MHNQEDLKPLANIEQKPRRKKTMQETTIYSAVNEILALLCHESAQHRATKEFRLAYSIFTGLLDACDSFDFEELEELDGENFEEKTLDDFEDKEYIALATISFDSFCDQISDDIYDSLFNGLNYACEKRADFSDLETWYNFTDYINRREFAVLLKNHLLKEDAVASVYKDGLKFTIVTADYPLDSLKEYAELYASKSVKLRIWDIN